MILSDLIVPHAAGHPDRPALVFQDKPLSYAELAESVSRCAEGLARIGVKKGDALALLLRNSPEFVVFTLAISKLGAVSVPINFLEKAERIALILNDAKAVGILTAKEFYRAATSAAKSVPSLKHFFLRDGDHKEFKAFADLVKAPPRTAPDAAIETDLMMLLYTSGTTGLPKGVMLTHRNFLANVEQCLRSIHATEKDRFLCLLPLFHSFSFTTCLLIPLRLGTRTVIIETLLPFDPVIKAIWKHKITLFIAVPQIYAALAAKIRGAKALVLRFLNPVRVCISGAAPLAPKVHRAFEKTFNIKLLEGYGLTECAPVVSFNPIEKRKIGTVGLPLPGVTVQVHDEDGKALPQGAVGEIYVRGDNVMAGYYNRKAETVEAFTRDGWLKTGDMGRFDEDGYLAIVDRKKDLIIIKGLNVYPQEVETVIAADENVKEVAVVGKTDPDTGEETVRAFVTAKDGTTIDKSALFARCREHLAAFKRPREIFVIDEMPKNALQKILKKDLRQRP